MKEMTLLFVQEKNKVMVCEENLLYGSSTGI